MQNDKQAKVNQRGAAIEEKVEHFERVIERRGLRRTRDWMLDHLEDTWHLDQKALGR
ncbi:hypothetical protein KOR42_05660 [Thalassoglobus neptunius]|uniref:Uncharacterized protein n=1 Tax=Thalassoglobus neptunius TaxID=1938619 RepID=A0A5C5X331_9PLAN|nr:hypothetical protein KOR42_05660 [Thalassoglobus neptunius]